MPGSAPGGGSGVEFRVRLKREILLRHIRTGFEEGFDGVEDGEEDIFPDPASQSVADGWRNSAAKALERQFAAFVPGNAA